MVKAGIRRGPVSSVFSLSRLCHACFGVTLPSIFNLVIDIICGLTSAFFVTRSGSATLVTNISLYTPIFATLVTFNGVCNRNNDSLVSHLLKRSSHRNANQIDSFYFCITLAANIILTTLVVLFHIPLLNVLNTATRAVPRTRTCCAILTVNTPTAILGFVRSGLIHYRNVTARSVVNDVNNAIVGVVLSPVLVAAIN